MTIDKDFEIILDYAHFRNWVPDWYVVKDIYKCIWHCTKILLTVVALCIIIYQLIPQNSLICSLLVFVISIFIVLGSALVYMNRNTRNKLIQLLISKFLVSLLLYLVKNIYRIENVAINGIIPILIFILKTYEPILVIISGISTISSYGALINI